jgi:hypothetical protein
MKIDANLLRPNTWTGTFYPPERPDLSFGATLSYSPTDGIGLKYSIPIDAKFDEEYSCLHGVVDHGLPCTLIGKFMIAKSGFSLSFGHSFRTHDRYPFLCIVFGLHCDSAVEFEAYQFDVTGAQEFFAPEGSKRYMPFKQGALISAAISDDLLEVSHTGKFDFVPDDLQALIHSPNTAALSELQGSYERIREVHPDFRPFLKLSLDFKFKICFKNDYGVIPAFQDCVRASNLFSVLYFAPAAVSEFYALAKDEDGKTHPLPIFPAAAREKDSIDRCLQERSYHLLPLNNSHVDLPTLIANWWTQDSGFRSIVSLFQSRGTLISSHAVLSSIVLSATQLEDIAYQAKAKSEKFLYGIKQHASSKLQSRLCALLQTTSGELGEAISDLRNEIAHIGRPKSYLSQLSSRQLYEVSVVLEAVIAGYILEKIGVSVSSREHYQDVLIR